MEYKSGKRFHYKHVLYFFCIALIHIVMHSGIQFMGGWLRNLSSKMMTGVADSDVFCKLSSSHIARELG